MGIKKSITKLLGSGQGADKHAGKGEQTRTKMAPPPKIEPQYRQAGSRWEHKHDDLDWHTMSIPHPISVPKGGPNNSEQQMSLSKKDIFCKFVIQDNKRIGETISLDSGRLVFKSGARNLSIPVSSIMEVTKEEVKVGVFDQEKALTLGDEWTRRTTDKLNFDEKGMLIND